MELLQKIKAARMQARRASDKVLTATLTTLVGDIEKGFKDNLKGHTSLAIVTKNLKNARTTLGLLKPDTENYQEILGDIATYESFMPQMLSPEELRRQVLKCRSVCDMNMGKIMAHFKVNFAGQYDGRELSSIVKGLLK